MTGGTPTPGSSATSNKPARLRWFRENPAIGLLCASVVLTIVGMTAVTFRGDGTAINAFLFLTLQMSHSVAARIEKTAMAFALVLALGLLLRPHWALLLPVSAYAFAEALARVRERGYAFSEWALTAQAPRYLVPIAIILLITRIPGFRIERSRHIVAMWILRIALALVFAAHGLEALRSHPEFIDLIIGSASNFLKTRVSESAAVQALQVIGVMDMAIASALLLRPSTAALWWAAFWGTLTAFSRMSAYGFGSYPDVLVRTTHFLGPIALWLLAARANTSRIKDVLPDEDDTNHEAGDEEDGPG